MAAPGSKGPAGPRARPGAVRLRSQRRRRRIAFWLLPSLLGAAALGTALTMALWEQPVGDLITLHSGERLHGRIVAAEAGRLVVETEDGERRRLRSMAIQEVALVAPDGTHRRGRFIDWQDGVYRIRAGDQDVLLRDGAPVIGYGVGSVGRYGVGGLLRERFVPRLAAADLDGLGLIALIAAIDVPTNLPDLPPPGFPQKRGGGPRPRGPPQFSPAPSRDIPRGG